MELTQFDAAITRKQVFDREVPDDHGQHRRIMLMSLTLSSQEMREKFQQNEETLESLMDMLEATNDYVNHLKALTEMSESAVARLYTILKEVIDEEK